MSTSKIFRNLVSPVRIALILSVILCLLSLNAFAQKENGKNNLPNWKSYKDVTLGMTADQVREKMGEPKSEDDESLFYMISETETAQFVLDANKNVRIISVIYTAEHIGAPAFADVFGKAAVAEPRTDGSVFKMVRFEEAGFWVSYNRMAGEKAMVIVIIQKL